MDAPDPTEDFLGFVYLGCICILLRSFLAPSSPSGENRRPRAENFGPILELDATLLPDVDRFRDEIQRALERLADAAQVKLTPPPVRGISPRR